MLADCKTEKSIATKVEGLSALAMEVTDTDDPVEVGTDTSYEIRVTNTGSKDETDVKLVCVIPPQMKFKSADRPGEVRRGRPAKWSSTHCQSWRPRRT